MSAQGYETALPFILRWEGGFVDNRADRGGRTNRGITQKVYDAWRVQKGVEPRDVKLLEEAEMRAIYHDNYWMPSSCNVLEAPLDLVQFDTAVNMGVGRAVRFLQTAVGCGVDGAFGPGTRKALETCDQGSMVATYCDAREAFYRRLSANDPSQQIFLKGWMNRLNALRKQAGLPGFEAALTLDFGDTPYIAKVPDGPNDP